MASFVVALPILAGKEEPWRRFAQELLGSRIHEYEDFRRRMGLEKESVRLTYSAASRQEMAVAYLEITDPKHALGRFMESEHPFDLLLKEKLVELHGCDLAKPKVAPEMIFAFPPSRGWGPAGVFPPSSL